jgi:hypothetical protein
VAALDPKVNGVFVMAEVSAHPGGRTFQVTVQPRELAV